MSTAMDEISNCTPVRRPRKQRHAPDTYFNSLFEGVEDWYFHLSLEALNKGYGEPSKPLSDLDVQAMYAGQTQKFLIPYVNGKGSHAMLISVYKRDEGQKVYEITAYNS